MSASLWLGVIVIILLMAIDAHAASPQTTSQQLAQIQAQIAQMQEARPTARLKKKNTLSLGVPCAPFPGL